MKNFTLMLFGLSLFCAFSAPSFAAEESEESHYCSASIIYQNGDFREMARVECSSELAGHCVQEVQKDGSWHWEIKADSVCESYAKK